MKNKISLAMSLGDIIAQHPQCRELLEKLGLDYCCGGKHNLSDAAIAAGLNPEDVLSKLNQVIESQPQVEQKDFLALSASDLVDHIETTHHVFMKEQLPRLSSLFSKVKQAHGEKHGPLLASVEDVYNQLRAEIELHLEKEEQILFPYIRQIEAHVEGGGPLPQMHCGSVKNPIQQMEHEHDVAGNALSRMHVLTTGYQLPDDGCETFKALYDGLQAVEQDLHQHIHLENNILFPKAIQMEKKMGQ